MRQHEVAFVLVQKREPVPSHAGLVGSLSASDVATNFEIAVNGADFWLLTWKGQGLSPFAALDMHRYETLITNGAAGAPSFPRSAP